jgi:hypothetical protein
MAVCLFVLALLQEDEILAPRKELRIYAKADVWFASFESSGRLENWFGKKGSGEEKDPRMSFHREGQLGETEPVPGLEIAIEVENEKHQYAGLRLAFRYGTWSESGAVGEAFSIDGTTVPAGSPFHSRFSFQQYDLGGIAGWRPPQLPVELWGWFGFSVHLEDFKMSTVSGDLKDGAGGLNFVFGGHAEIRPLPFLFAAGELSGAIAFGVPETQAMICAGVTWGGVRLEAGYRHVWAAWDPDPDFRLSMGGPFVGLEARF